MARFLVTSDADGVSDPEDPKALTLRGAIERAIATPGADRIAFAEDISKIDLQSHISIGASARILIDGDHNDDGISDVELSGSDVTRHFTVGTGANVVLDGLTLTEGHQVGSSGGDAASSIYNLGQLRLNDVTFEDNYAKGGNGATGSTGYSGTSYGKSPGGYHGADGTNGGPGGKGGTGGDAATVMNAGGKINLNNVLFDPTNEAVAGTGGRGGTGGKGGNGGEGGDFKFPRDPGKGGDGGNGGTGGEQGEHGEAGSAVLNLYSWGVVRGNYTADPSDRTYTQDSGYNVSSGGSGGSAGKGGKVAGIRVSSGDSGTVGSGRATVRGDLTTKVIAGEDSAAGKLTRFDATFSVFGPGDPISEGDTITFGVVRSSHADGPWAVHWSIPTDFLLTERDFIGPTSGTVNFSEDGADIQTASVTVRRDATLEAQEEFRIVLSSPTSLVAVPETGAITGGPAVLAIASELPSDGDDEIRGTRTADNLLLRDGDDVARGRGGNDVLKGEDGRDKIFGQTGNDLLTGGRDQDTLIGGRGNDTLRGDAGDDRLVGDAGADVITGGRGSDRIIGGGGDDTVSGQGGADVFVFGRGDGNDTVTDFRDGQDLIEITSGASRFGALDIAQDGSDAVVSFANVEITLTGTNAADLTADDFLFT